LSCVFSQESGDGFGLHSVNHHLGSLKSQQLIGLTIKYDLDLTIKVNASERGQKDFEAGDVSVEAVHGISECCQISLETGELAVLGGVVRGVNGNVGSIVDKLCLHRGEIVREAIDRVGDSRNLAVLSRVLGLEGSNLRLKFLDVSLALLPRVGLVLVVVGVRAGSAVVGGTAVAGRGGSTVLLGLDSSGDSSNGCNDKSGAHDLNVKV